MTGDAVLMHIGIGLALGLIEFGLAMIAGNLAFVSGRWLRSLVAGRERPPPGRVLYDGACPRCRESMALIAAADPDQVVEPVDLTAVNVATIHPSLTREACLRAMHLVRPDGKVDVGFDAVLTLCAGTPCSIPRRWWEVCRGCGRWVATPIIEWRPVARATSLAPTTPAASISTGRRPRRPPRPRGRTNERGTRPAGLGSWPPGSSCTNPAGKSAAKRGASANSAA